MKSAFKIVAATVLAVPLALALVACGGGQAAQDQGASASSAGQTAATGSVDVSSWKTLGDGLAAQSGNFATAAWNDSRYVAVFEAGDSVVRVVAEMTPEVDGRIADLDGSAGDYDKKFAEVVGGQPLLSAEDITAEKLTQDEVDAYKGKTGQDLMNDGFAFQSYYMTGGDQTGVTMAKGYIAYNVTFDASVPEGGTEDDGAAIKSAPIADIEFAGGSDEAVNPETV